MGNCKSKRQNSANCESHQSDESNQRPNGTCQDDVIQEQVSSTTTKNINSPNKFKNKCKQNEAHSSGSYTKNDAVIDSTKAEVNSLLEGINNFQGTSQNDKDYKFLDEMLTRCILKLDTIECSSSRDRTNRKEAIRGVNEAISILERKLELNSEIKDVGANLRTDQ
jgi:hypothetical protein